MRPDDGIKIGENLGDFDSLDEQPSPAPLQSFPSEKDETDGELAVDRALQLGCDSVCIYGGGGGREDHFLGNVHLLLKSLRGGMHSAVMRTNGAWLSLHTVGEYEFACKRGQTVSLLPFGGDAHIMGMRGLKYLSEDLRLCYGTTRGVSNVTTEESFCFRVERGYVLVILNEEAQ